MTTLHRIPDDDAPRTWAPGMQPSPHVCARRFCFNYLADGDAFAPGLYADLEAAVAAAEPVHGNRCGWSLGRCRRLGVDAADPDFYEPCEPELDRAGLPRTFFTPVSVLEE